MRAYLPYTNFPHFSIVSKFNKTICVQAVGKVRNLDIQLNKRLKQHVFLLIGAHILLLLLDYVFKTFQGVN